MKKIKDLIINENDLNNIMQLDNKLRLNLKNCSGYVYINAKIEDIEWNYGTPQETQRQMQKELCKSCYYRDTISNKLKELEEENKKLKEELEDLKMTEKLEREY